MASPTEKDIDNLDDDDLMSGLEMLENCRLSTDNISSVHDVKKRLRESIASTRSVMITKKESEAIVKQLSEDHSNARAELCRILQQISDVLKKLPDRHLSRLVKMYPDLKTTMKEATVKLENEDTIILVAGECGSGKSSLINLLLSENLLPVSHVATTAVICELHYSERKYVRLFHKSLPAREVDLSKSPTSILSQFIDQQKQTHGKSDYSKVQVFWPFDLLKEGVTLVDTPGVGGDEELTELVKQYLPKASAFIFVINTPNAGGIQPDRLQDLMFSHLGTKQGSRFNPARAMFICNKMDQVHANEKQPVKDMINTKIAEIWPNFSEDQIFYTSVEMDRESLKNGFVSHEFQGVLKGLKNLIPKGLKDRLSPIHGFAVSVLERCIFELKTFLMDESRTLDQKEDLVKALKTLDDVDPKRLLSNIDKVLDKKKEAAIFALETYLNSNANRRYLETWDPPDCPMVDDAQKLALQKEAFAIARIRNAIDKWDREEGIVNKAMEQVTSYFEEEHRKTLIAIHKIEEQVMGKRSSIRVSSTFETPDFSETYFQTSDGSGLSVRDKVMIGLAAPLWLPVGLICSIVALPAFGIKKMMNLRRNSKQFKEYNENKCDEMATATKHVLQQWMNGDHLDKIISFKFRKLKEEIEQSLDKLMKRISADRKVIKEQTETISQQKDSATRTLTYDLLKTVDNLLGELNFMLILKLRTDMIAEKDFSNIERVGIGSFAVVSKAKWRQSGNKHRRTVALKRLKKALTYHNSSEFVMEEQVISSIKSAHVVSYYGMSLFHVDNSVFPVLVLEFCETSLDKVISSCEYHAPGDRSTSNMNAALNECILYALQICQGLIDIHSAGLIHRDIKTENILLSSHGTLKLADLGMAKNIHDATGTVVGTPLYMAPEVWNGEEYTEKIDIFSFGMILWELWYGIGIEAKYQVDNLAQFTANPFLSGEPKPLDTLLGLMKACWGRDSYNRPSAKQCYRVLRDMKPAHESTSM